MFTNTSGKPMFLTMLSKNPLKPFPSSLSFVFPPPLPFDPVNMEAIEIPTSARSPLVLRLMLDFFAASVVTSPALKMMFPLVSGRTTSFLGVVGRSTLGTPSFFARSPKDMLLGNFVMWSSGKRFAPPMAPPMVPENVLVRFNVLLIHEDGKFIAVHARPSWASVPVWPSSPCPPCGCSASGSDPPSRP